MAKKVLMTAAISGLLVVALGAFGAHGLKARLAADMLAIYQTGVQYHFYHSLALLVTALVMMQAPKVVAFRWAAVLFIAGTVIFSGSLYLLAISGIRWLGAITPIGGLLLMAGWAALSVGSFQWQKMNQLGQHD